MANVNPKLTSTDADPESIMTNVNHDLITDLTSSRRESAIVSGLLTPSDSDTSDSEKPSDLVATKEITNPDFPLPPPTTIPSRVLDLDIKTPDGWLARDPRLIRLTGVHPFNVEAPLTAHSTKAFSHHQSSFTCEIMARCPKCRLTPSWIGRCRSKAWSSDPSP